MAVVGFLPFISLTHAQEEDGMPSPELYEMSEESVMPDDMEGREMQDPRMEMREEEMGMRRGGMEEMGMMRNMDGMMEGRGMRMMGREGMNEMKAGMMSDKGERGSWEHHDGRNWGWVMLMKFGMFVFGTLFLFAGAFALRFGWELAGRWPLGRK